MTHRQLLNRLAEIQAREGTLLTTLADLREERVRLLSLLALQPDPPVQDTRTHHIVAIGGSLPPLPMGKQISPSRRLALKEEIDHMSPDAFATQGRDFITTWYPRLCMTPTWHEFSTALQLRFGVRRQQVAGVAARIVRKGAASTATAH